MPRRTAKSKYADFPDELWLQVFGYLDRAADRNTKLSLRKTTKRFNALIGTFAFCKVYPRGAKPATNAILRPSLE
jgi:hypothetical protein